MADDPVALGAGAARLVSGTTAEHLELERELAGWLEAEAALMFSSAYAANVGVVAALGERGDTIFSDALNHASIIDGCRLSRAEVVIYPHLDVEAVARGLRERRGGAGQCWVVTESYFGMDGDVPELARLRAVCDSHDAGLVVDEAHALGVFGAEGRGLCAVAGVVPDVLVGGLGKALGAQGGFVAGARVFVEWFWNRARTFVFSTAVSPLLTRHLRRRLLEVRRDAAGRAALGRHEVRLERRLVEAGVRLAPGRRGPIFPILLGSEARALSIARGLGEGGIGVQAIRPPTVPPGSSRLRVILRADMSDEEVDALGNALARALDLALGASGEDVNSAQGGSFAPREVVPGAGLSGTAGGALVWPGARRGLSALAAVHSPGGRDVTEQRDDSGDPSSGVDGPGLAQAGRALSVSSAPGGAGGGPRSEAAGSGAGRWVVLGTGTGVGKTFVAVGLVRILGRSGAAAGLKPIETGVESPSGTDAAALQEASFHVKHPTPHPLYAFREPVTPSRAARLARQPIEPALVRSWIEQTAADGSASPPALVVETAGGVFSPLGPDLDNLRLARDLDPACWVLVAMDRLGVLHEVASTLHALRALGRLPDCIVLNAPPAPDASTGTNLAELREMGLALPAIQLPRGDFEPLASLIAQLTSNRRAR